MSDRKYRQRGYQDQDRERTAPRSGGSLPGGERSGQSHGRGLGRLLLEHAERRTLELGLDRIRLYTHVTMVENQALYERTGYVETARRTEHGFTRVFYEKRL